jgi:hypothetical protein
VIRRLRRAGRPAACDIFAVIGNQKLIIKRLFTPRCFISHSSFVVHQ